MQGRVCSSGTPRNGKESEQASSGQEPPFISFSFPSIYLRRPVYACWLTWGNEDPRSQGLCLRSPGVGWGCGLSCWSWALPGVSSFLSRLSDPCWPKGLSGGWAKMPWGPQGRWGGSSQWPYCSRPLFWAFISRQLATLQGDLSKCMGTAFDNTESQVEGGVAF